MTRETKHYWINYFNICSALYVESGDYDNTFGTFYQMGHELSPDLHDYHYIQSRIFSDAFYRALALRVISQVVDSAHHFQHALQHNSKYLISEQVFN